MQLKKKKINITQFYEYVIVISVVNVAYTTVSWDKITTVHEWDWFVILCMHHNTATPQYSRDINTTWTMTKLTFFCLSPYRSIVNSSVINHRYWKINWKHSKAYKLQNNHWVSVLLSVINVPNRSCDAWRKNKRKWCRLHGTPKEKILKTFRGHEATMALSWKQNPKWYPSFNHRCAVIFFVWGQIVGFITVNQEKKKHVTRRSMAVPAEWNEYVDILYTSCITLRRVERGPSTLKTVCT